MTATHPIPVRKFSYNSHQRLHPATIFGLFICFVLLSIPANAGRYQLVGTFVEHADKTRPADWIVSENQLTLETSFQRRYRRDDCIGNYRVRFEFDTPFSTLVEGQAFRVVARKLLGRTPCGFRWTDARVNEAGLLPKNTSAVPLEWEYNGNISELEAIGGKNSALPLWDDSFTSMEVRLIAQQLRSLRYTSMSFEAGDNKFYFIYEYVPNHAPLPEVGIRAGQYVDRGGFGNVTLVKNGSGFTGTYDATYDQDSPGRIEIKPDGHGGYIGEWSEPRVGRSGLLENITVSKDGHSFSTQWRVTVPGYHGARALNFSNGSSTFKGR